MSTINEVEYVLKIILKARDELAAGLSKARVQLRGFKTDVESMSTAVDKVNGILDKFDGNLAKVTQRLESWRSTLRSTGDDAKELTKALDKVGKQAETTARKTSAAGKTQEQLQQQARALRNEMADLTKAREIDAVSAKFAASEYDKLSRKLEEVSLNMSRAARTKTPAHDWAIQAKEAADTIREIDKEMDDDLRRHAAEERKALTDHEALVKRVYKEHADAAIRAYQLEQEALKESERESERALREHEILVRRVYKEHADAAVRAYQEETAAQKERDKASEASIKKQQEINRLENLLHTIRRKPAGSRDAADAAILRTLSRDYDKLAGSVKDNNAEFRKFTVRAAEIRQALAQMGSEADRSQSKWQRLRKTWNEMGDNIATLDNRLRGIILLAVASFAEQLTTAVTALGGELVALAGSAAVAGGALGGILTAGAAQALPVIGLLAGAFSRVNSVMEAFQQNQKLQQAQATDAEKSGQKAIDQSNALASANDQVTAANERLAESRRDLTGAQKDAERQVEDLAMAEKEAALAAEGAALSVKEAQIALQDAIRRGESSTEIQRRRLAVDEARLNQQRSRTDLGRAREDNAAVGGDFRNVDSYQNAVKQVEQAKRAVEQAGRGLDQAQDKATRAASSTMTAAATLNYLLSQMSPAERKLYAAVNRIYGHYQKIFIGDKKRNGIYGVIISSFADAVNEVDKIMRMPKVIKTLQNLANTIGAQIDKVVGFLSSSDELDQFLQITKDAQDNLGPLVDMALDLADAFTNIAVAANPALQALLEYLKPIVGSFLGMTENKDKMEDFFTTGEKHLETWLDLIFAIIDLFATLFGASADTGKKSIEELTDKVKDWTKWLEDNGDKVRQFFDDSYNVVKEIGGVLESLAEEIFKTFSPEHLEAFAEFLRETVAPALGGIVRTLGDITDLILLIVDNPIGSELAKLGLMAFVFAQLGTSAIGAIHHFGNLIKHIGSLGGGLKRFATRGKDAKDSLKDLGDEMDDFNKKERDKARIPDGPGSDGREPTTKKGSIWSKIFGGGAAAGGGAAMASEGGAAGAAAGAAVPVAIGAAILALAASMAWVLDHFGKLEDIWKAIQDATKEVWEPFTEAVESLTEAFEGLGGALEDVGIKFGKNKDAAEVAEKILSGFAEGIGEFIEHYIVGFIKLIGGVLTFITRFVAGTLKIWRGIADVIIGFFTLDPDQMLKGIKRIWAGIKDYAKAITDGLGKALEGIGEAFLSPFIGAWKAIKKWFGIESPSKKAIELGGAIVSGITAGLKGLTEAFTAPFRTAWEAVKAIFNPDEIMNKLRGIPGFDKLLGPEQGGTATPGIRNNVRGPVYGPPVPPKQKYGPPVPDKSATTDDYTMGNLFAVDTKESKKEWKEFWDAIVVMSRRGANEVEKQFRDMRLNTSRSANSMYESVRGSMADIEHSMLVRGDNMVDSWSKTWLSMEKVTYDGLNYIGHETNKALKGLGETHINFGLTVPKVEKKQRGGVIGGFGDGDSQLVLAEPGEGFINKTAVRALGGPGVINAINSLIPRFQKGGTVGLPDVLGAKPGFAVFMAYFKKAFDNMLYVMSGSRPGSIVAGSNGRISNHSAGNAVDISNPISAGGSQGNPPPQNSLDKLHAFIAKYLPQPPRLDFLWRTPEGGNHFNHIHLGLSPLVTATIDAARAWISKHFPDAGDFAPGDSVKKQKVTGPGGAMRSVLQKVMDRVTKSANKKVEDSVAGSIDDVGGGSGDSDEFKGGVLSQSQIEATIRRALRVLDITTDTALWVKAVTRQAFNESRFDPNARNDTPAGVAAGGPKGLMQVVDGTFAAYSLPGHKNVFNPLDNIIAAIRYVIERYGGAQGLWAHGGGAYADGGVVSGSEGKPVGILAHAGEWVLNKGQQLRAAMMAGLSRSGLAAALGFTGGPFSFAGGGEVLHIGDSLGVGMGEALKHMVKGLVDWSKVGINSDRAFQELKKRLKDTYKEVIFDVGTNDAQASTLKKNLQKAYKLLGEDQTMTVSTVRGPGADAKNKILRQFAASHENVRLVDDAAKAVGVAADGIHRSAKGYKERAKLFADAIKKQAVNLEDLLGSDAFRSVEDITKALGKVFKVAKQSSNSISRVVDAVDVATRDGGLFDQLRAAIERQMSQAQLRLRRAQFQVYNAGRGIAGVRRIQDDVEVASGAVVQARGDRDLLTAERRQIQREKDEVDRRLKSKKLTEKQRDILTAQSNKLQGRLDEANERVQQNVEDIFAAQEALTEAIIAQQQAVIDGINKAAETRAKVLDVEKRIRTAMGWSLDGINDSLIANMQENRDRLMAQVAGLRSRGLNDLADSVFEQAEDLKAQIAELAATMFQDSVDAINKAATRKLGHLDLFQRMADAVGTIGGAVGIPSLGSGVLSRAGILSARGDVLTGQRDQLQGRLRQAEATGNLTQIDDLTDQLAELDVAIVENTKAQIDFKVSEAQNTFDYNTTINDLNLRLIDARDAVSGNTSTASRLALMQEKAALLLARGNELQQFLNEARARGDDKAVQDLTKQLLENQIAVEENTKVINDVTGAGQAPQTFASLPWQWFRSPFFNGTNGILPTYQPPISAFGSPLAGGSGAGSTFNQGGNTYVTNIEVNEAGQPIDETRLAGKVVFAQATAQ